MKKISLIPVLVVGALLLYAADDFPEWGSPTAPASASSLSSHFISNTGVDTEVPNMVTAVLADYRGFDTMFETVVVFIAGMAVLAILKGSSGPYSKTKNFTSLLNQILLSPIRFDCWFLLFKFLLFYVLAHGHVSPEVDFRGEL